MSGIRHYRKQPVVIEAMVNDGYNTAEVRDWILENGGQCRIPQDGWLIIETLEGEMMAGPNWYVIRGIKGEFYGCDPAVFADSYTEVVPDENEEGFVDADAHIPTLDASKMIFGEMESSPARRWIDHNLVTFKDVVMLNPRDIRFVFPLATSPKSEGIKIQFVDGDWVTVADTTVKEFAEFLEGVNDA